MNKETEHVSVRLWTFTRPHNESTLSWRKAKNGLPVGIVGLYGTPGSNVVLNIVAMKHDLILSRMKSRTKYCECTVTPTQVQKHKDVFRIFAANRNNPGTGGEFKFEPTSDEFGNSGGEPPDKFQILSTKGGGIVMYLDIKVLAYTKLY
jgi:hypothetical protein